MQPGGKGSSPLDSVKVKLQNLSDNEKKIGAGVGYVLCACRVVGVDVNAHAPPPHHATTLLPPAEEEALLSDVQRARAPRHRVLRDEIA